MKELGPQDGTGKITGHFDGDTLILNLNPEAFGDNVYLYCKVTKADLFKIKGKWGHYGYYDGKIFQGILEMDRKNKYPPKPIPPLKRT